MKNWFRAQWEFLGAAALTVTLFTLPVPETAGKLAGLNHPVFLLLLAAVLLLATWAGPAFRSKAEEYTTRLSEDARFGNRLFQVFRLRQHGTAQRDGLPDVQSADNLPPL